MSNFKRYLNTHKCENKSEFKNSIFSEVYFQACGMVDEIIEANQRFNEKNELEQFCNENYISNTICFLGERGMGKSSAMLSFSYFLKIYHTIEDWEKNDPYKIPSVKDGKFYVLSKIDATMMSKEESLLDILLAKMWDAFHTKVNEQSSQKKSYIFTQEKFEKTKQVYSSYWKEEKAVGKIQKYSPLEELHELSQSINLRKCITELVEYYLEFMMDNEKNTYLVITVDDLDLVQENVYDKIDYIRLFLTIPRVIILVTADMNRLEMNFSTLFSKQFLCEYNVNGNEKEYVRTYTEEYLKKVFPRNMRIYMPYDDPQIVKKFINENTDLFIQIYKADVLNPICPCSDVDLQITENALISSLIVKNTNIMLFSNFYVYSIKSKNLRDLVNNLYELVQISCKIKSMESTYRWMLKELLISENNIKDDSFISYINEMKRVSEEELNGYLIQLNIKIYRDIVEQNHRYHDDSSKQKDNVNSIKILKNQIGYGAVLCSILLQENETNWDSEITRQMIWIYSICISRSINLRKWSKLKNLLQRDIFSTMSFVNYSFIENMPELKNLQLNFEIETCNFESFEFVNKYKKNFIKFFWKLFVFDMSNLNKKFKKAEIKDKEEGESIINENKEVETNSSKKNYVLKIEDVGKISIDNLFYNILDLEKYWDGYFENLCKNAYLGIITGNKKKKLKEIMENNLGINLKEYRQWKEQYGIKGIQDLIPVQNVGIMLEVLEQLEGISVNADTMICDYFKSIINIMKNIFLKAEKYCQVDILQKNIKKNSSALSKLLQIIDNLYQMFDWKFNSYSSVKLETDTTT